MFSNFTLIVTPVITFLFVKHNYHYRTGLSGLLQHFFPHSAFPEFLHTDDDDDGTNLDEADDDDSNLDDENDCDDTNLDDDDDCDDENNFEDDDSDDNNSFEDDDSDDDNSFKDDDSDDNNGFEDKDDFDILPSLETSTEVKTAVRAKK